MVKQRNKENGNDLLSGFFDDEGQIRELNYRDARVIAAGTGRGISDVMTDYYLLAGCLSLIVRPAVWVGSQITRARGAVRR